MGKNAGCEFVESIFGRGRELGDTEKLTNSIRVWKTRFDVDIEDIRTRVHFFFVALHWSLVEASKQERRDPPRSLKNRAWLALLPHVMYWELRIGSAQTPWLADSTLSLVPPF